MPSHPNHHRAGFASLTGAVTPRLKAKRVRAALRWMSAGVTLVLLPKCLLCLAAYAGLGAALGLTWGAPELCGASTESHAAAFAGLTLPGAVVAIWILSRHRGTAKRRLAAHRGQGEHPCGR